VGRTAPPCRQGVHVWPRRPRGRTCAPPSCHGRRRRHTGEHSAERRRRGAGGVGRGCGRPAGATASAQSCGSRGHGRRSRSGTALTCRGSGPKAPSGSRVSGRRPATRTCARSAPRGQTCPPIATGGLHLSCGDHFTLRAAAILPGGCDVLGPPVRRAGAPVARPRPRRDELGTAFPRKRAGDVVARANAEDASGVDEYENLIS
jgi:hypothetical protein